MTVDQGLLDRDLPEPHYRAVYRNATCSSRKWHSRQDMQYWLDAWGKKFGVIGVVRVTMRSACHS